MADRLWSAWYDAVLPHAPGCPVAVASYEIKRAAIEFCDRSLAWRKPMTAIDSAVGVGEYTLPDVAAGVMVVQLLEARWLGVKLTKKRPDELESLYAPTDWRAVPGTPLYFTQETPNAVRLVPAPNVLTVAAINGLWAAVKPKDDATGIDDAVAGENYTAIADGALRNIFRSPKKKYTNPTLADAHGAIFDSEIGNAAYRAFRGGAGTTTRTQTSFT